MRMRQTQLFNPKLSALLDSEKRIYSAVNEVRIVELALEEHYPLVSKSLATISKDLVAKLNAIRSQIKRFSDN